MTIATRYAVISNSPEGIDGWYSRRPGAEKSMGVWRKRFPKAELTVIETIHPWAFPDSHSLPCIFSGQDLFSQWIDDNCETGPDAWEPPRLMFAAWKKYAEQHNEAVGTQTTFKERMESAGFRQLRDHARGRYWVGIRVVSEPAEDAPY